MDPNATISSNFPEPPSLSPPLRLAIVGRKRAGKTTLLSHISSVWGAPETLSPHLPVARPPNPLFARLFASRLGVLASRGLRFVLRAVCLFRRPAECTAVSLRNGGTVWDPISGNVTVAVVEAVDFRVDLILFVTRLDDGRVSRADRLQLVELVNCFGEDVLEKTVFVFTHGCATPPADLTFKDFVRGRRDLLWQFVSDMLPPIELPHPEQSADPTQTRSNDREELPQPDNEDMVTNAGGDEVLVCNGSVDNEVPSAEIGSTASGQNDDVASQPGAPQEAVDPQSLSEHGENSRENGSGDPVRTSGTTANGDARQSGNGDDDANQEENGGDQFRIRPDKLDELLGDVSSDDMSLTSVPDDVVGRLWEMIVHPKDDRLFTDRCKPPAVVVEMSEACPKDERERKILPDGTAWLPNLLTIVSSMAQESRRRQTEAEELAALALGREPQRPPGFWRQIREMLESLRKDAFRILLAEIAILVLALQVGSSIKKFQERRRQKALDAIDDDDDVLLEMSDEEYEALTKPDENNKPFVLYDDMPKEEPEVESENEKEFFGSEGSKLDLDVLENEKSDKQEETGGDEDAKAK